MKLKLRLKSQSIAASVRQHAYYDPNASGDWASNNQWESYVSRNPRTDAPTHESSEHAEKGT